MRELYFYELDVYPEPELFGSKSATRVAEVSEEEFIFITNASNHWQTARKILLKRAKSLKK